MKKTKVLLILLILVVVTVMIMRFYFIYVQPRIGDVKPNTTFLNEGQNVSAREVDDLISRRISMGSVVYEFSGTEGESASGDAISGKVSWKDYSHYKIEIKKDNRDVSYLVNKGVLYFISSSHEKWTRFGSISGENGQGVFDFKTRPYAFDSLLIGLKDNIENAKFIEYSEVDGFVVRVFKYSFFTKGKTIQFNVELSVDENGFIRKANIEKIVLPDDYVFSWDKNGNPEYTHENGSKENYNLSIQKIQPYSFKLDEFVIHEDKIIHRDDVKTESLDMESVDTDSDGIFDVMESGIYKTDPNKYDTDEDSYSDGSEIDNGHSPLIKAPNDKQMLYF